jgi:spermidine synthase
MSRVHYTEVARAESPRGEIVLRERRDPEAGPNAPVVLELRVNGVFVMDTCETSSEKGLATTALKQVADPRTVLVGGLGLGFTMHEVLADKRVERLVVVEIEDALVQWMRDGTVPHGPAYLADERVSVVAADIRVAMAEASPATYDLVLLDVDNGPGFLVYDDNAAIYQQQFLGQARECLRPGGALVIWSAAESPALQREMRDVLGDAVAVPYDVALQSREEHYWIYLARRKA